MIEQKVFDVAVIGGGLAGLCCAVLLAKKGRSVILFEKEKFPFHKVCGEFIGMESWDFLETEIGLSLTSMRPAIINSLLISSPAGNTLRQKPGAGGFGLSRFVLDAAICDIARMAGVQVLEHHKVDAVKFENGEFFISANGSEIRSCVCIGGWGKKSNLDVAWERKFLKNSRPKEESFIGVKYHVTGNFAKNEIALHSFKNGYCGLSKIEDDKYSLCYFMKAENLRRAGNSISVAEEKILGKNPHLKKIFETAHKVNEVPLTISQVSLAPKSAVENHVLLLGDAAGMISPLCGNGMSIAMHNAKIAASAVNEFLSGALDRDSMERSYAAARKQKFGFRIAAGKVIQSLFGKEKAMDIAISTGRKIPVLARLIIASTHGKKF